MTSDNGINSDEELEQAAALIRESILPVSKAIVAPDSLKPENIANFAGSAPKPRHFSRWGAFAASFALIAACFLGVRGSLGSNQNTGMNAPMATSEVDMAKSAESNENNEILGLRHPSSYEELEEEVKKYAQRQYSYGEALFEGKMADAIAPQAASDNSGPRAVSGTNNQTIGIEESDSIKADGNNLYVLSQAKVNIFSIAGQGIEKIGALPSAENEEIREILLFGSKLVTISDAYYETESNGKTIVYVTNQPGQTSIRVYDASNPKDLKQLREFKQAGSFSAARLVGGALYTATLKYQSQYKSARPIPEYFDSLSGKGISRVALNDIAIVPNPSGNSYAIASAIDLSNDAKAASIKSVYGAGSLVYASDAAIYLIGNSYPTGTEIIRIAYSGASLGGVYRAVAPGYYNDSFSFGEYGGFFRAATNDQGKNYVTVFDSKLNEVGKTGAIAEGEQIKSVRFIGNMGYVVTFRQTDPLFCIDFSNPRQPKILGKVKLPGFSSYLHPLSEGLLLGVGYEGNMDGKITGIKYSVFDVRDPANPKEAYSLIEPLERHPRLFENYRVGVFSAEKQLFISPCLYSGNYGSKEMLSVFSIADGKIKHIGDVDNSSVNGQLNRAVIVGNKLYTVNIDQARSYTLLGLKPIASADMGFDSTYEPLFGYYNIYY